MVVKVRMFYIENSDSPQPVAIIVRGGPNPFLPDQGILVESVGEANESKRRVTVLRTYAEAPGGLFDSAIFTPESLSKQDYGD